MKVADQTNVTTQKYVCFDLGEESYGIPISEVKEIIKLQPLTRIPNSSNYVEGVLNLRGNVIHVIDMRKRLRLPEIERQNSSRIIIVDVKDHSVGIIVDSVKEVLNIGDSDIENPQAFNAVINDLYINGIAKIKDHLVILIYLQKILEKETIQELN